MAAAGLSSCDKDLNFANQICPVKRVFSFIISISGFKLSLKDDEICQNQKMGKRQ
jgi:hypothetical protein